LNYQNNYVGNLRVMSNAAKKQLVYSSNLYVLHNYFNNSIKLFSDVYLAKFLDFLAIIFSVYN